MDLADRTAALVPNVQAFTSDGSWSKPNNALWIAMVVVARGGDGGDGLPANGGAGGGGSSAEIVQWFGPASLVPDTLTINFDTGAQTVVSGTGFRVESTDGEDGADGEPSPDHGGKGGAHRWAAD